MISSSLFFSEWCSRNVARRPIKVWQLISCLSDWRFWMSVEKMFSWYFTRAWFFTSASKLTGVMPSKWCVTPTRVLRTWRHWSLTDETLICILTWSRVASAIPSNDLIRFTNKILEPGKSLARRPPTCLRLAHFTLISHSRPLCRVKKNLARYASSISSLCFLELKMMHSVSSASDLPSLKLSSCWDWNPE